MGAVQYLVEVREPGVEQGAGQAVQQAHHPGKHEELRVRGKVAGKTNLNSIRLDARLGCIFGHGSLGTTTSSWPSL